MNKNLQAFKKKVFHYFKLMDEFATRLEHHHVFLISAGVAFNILLYLIPLLLVALYVINKIFGVEMIASFLTVIIQEILPPNQLASDLITSTLREVNLIFGNSSVAGLIGLLSLVWLSSTLFASIRTGMNRIFDIFTNKIFFIYRIKDIFLTFMIAVLILFSSYALPIITLLVESMKENLQPPWRDYFSGLTFTLLSMGLSFLLFYGMFRFIPNKRQPRFIVFLSTFLSMIFIEISRNIFAWYVVKFGTYGKFYGTYAVIVSVSFWIYYMILIILLSGEISRFIYEKKILPKLEQKRHSGRSTIPSDE